VMNNKTEMGKNRTGIDLSPIDKKLLIEGAAQTNPAMVEYLANFNAWRAVGDDDDPFLAEPVRSEGAVAREGAGG